MGVTKFVAVSLVSFVFLVSLFTDVAHAQSSDYANKVAKIRESTKYQAATASLEQGYDAFIDELIELTEIPAPPFGEEKRASAYATKFEALGLEDVEIDPEGNVLGVRPGTHPETGLVVISAHLDTVFPLETDVTVKREGDVLRAPGVADDTLGLATILALARALDAAQIQTEHGILFVGTVGEEGPGDLRGVRYLFTEGKYKDDIASFLSIEPLDTATLINGGTGSKRYRATFEGPGGHSFNAFGIVSPSFAMADAVYRFGQLEVPADPKTTYSASVFAGGTSVNSIPFSVWVEVDMRSNSAKELSKLEKTFLSIVDEAVTKENQTRSTEAGKITAKLESIGDRPAGATPETSDLIQQAIAATEAHGLEPGFGYFSTDSNFPMSLGIPALTIGPLSPEQEFDGFHALDEYVTVPEGPMVEGLAATLTKVLTITGMQLE